MDILFGVPGKLKTLTDRLSATWAAKLDTLATNYTTARAALIDNIDAAVTTAADAAAWTSALAALLGSAARRRPVTSIVNYYSAGGVSGQFGYGGGIAEIAANVRGVLSGALTANTLATVINRTGAGAVFFLAATVMDTTSRTVRIKVTVDGTVVFDATSNAITTVQTGMQVVGSGLFYSVTQFFARPGYLEYDTSFKVEIASSLTETDKIKVWSNEITRA